MPLSPPVSRNHIHRRTVELNGYRREDGMWDIEGRLLDVKSYGFPNKDRGGEIPAGEAIHEMFVRLTVDDHYRIHRVEAVTEHAPFSICPSIAPAFSGLAGLTLGPGFLKELRTRFGGVDGCTHIVEMMGPLATTAFQTLAPLVKHELRGEKRPRILGTCHALDPKGPVVKREWPEWYEGDGRPEENN
ncbi:MAG TPA: DUF2889 domain-containing protein [Candidatus Sulfotelmatobacter sp.]|jgi:hypothetical protein|nr:DUF2889 domain-containing protein [Candidatus Sulfotelmatobacter sp.]